MSVPTALLFRYAAAWPPIRSVVKLAILIMTHVFLDKLGQSLETCTTQSAAYRLAGAAATML
jgi:hypothetical protein